MKKLIGRMVLYGLLGILFTFITNIILEKLGVPVSVSWNDFTFVVLGVLGLPGWILLFLMELFYF